MTASAEIVAQALAHIGQGFGAFALGIDTKVPITPHGFKDATRNPDVIVTQLLAPAAGNYGITWPQDAERIIVGFDLDNGSDGRERPWQDRLHELIDRLGQLPRTKATVTPSAGRHVFYGWPNDVPVPPGDELFGFTVRWPGRGYFVGPGSSINGRPYTSGPEPEIADLPPTWVEAALAEHRVPNANIESKAARGEFMLPDTIPAGRRYAALRDYIASRYHAGLSEDELWALVLAEVVPRFTVPKDDATLRADFARAIKDMPLRLGPPRRRAPLPPAELQPLKARPIAEFDSRPIEWLWPAWLPRDTVTILDGNPGASKSTLVTDLAARITAGTTWPDGTPIAKPGRALWITTEDDPGRVIRPRLEAAGGDPLRVLFVTSEVVFPGAGPAFTELLVRHASESEGLDLAILDPLFSHIEATVRSISDADMRRHVMNPLQAAAEAAHVAILVIRHFSKDVAASAINRGAGSLGGIVGAARALWTVSLDQSDDTGDTKVVGVSKLNYAKPHRPLLYRVVSRVPPGWTENTVSAIEWLGPAPMSIELMAGEDESAGAAGTALREMLEKGPQPARRVETQMKSSGFGRKSIMTAAKRLGVVKKKTGFEGAWQWALPAREDDRDARRSNEIPPSAAEVDDRAQNLLEPPAPRIPSPNSRFEGASWDLLGPLGNGSESTTGPRSPNPPQEAPGKGGFPQAGATSPNGWVRACRSYSEHGSAHRQTPQGWTCDTCYPDGDADDEL